MEKVTERKKYLISVDLGYHNTKAYMIDDKGNSVKTNFESKYKKVDKYSFNTDIVEYDSAKNLVGVGKYEIGSKKHERSNKIFLFNAIDRIFSDTYDEHNGQLKLTVSVGNPLIDLSHADEMKESLLGEFIFTANRRKYDICIERVFVGGEAYAAKYLLDSDKDTPDKYSIIDIGGGTINVLSVRDGEVDDYQTIPYGILKLYENLFDKVKDNRGVNGIEDLYKYMDTFKNHEDIEAGKINFIYGIDHAIEIFLFDDIFICGGGVEFLTKKDKDIFLLMSDAKDKNIVVMDEPIFVNCRGFYEMAKDTLEAESESVN